MGNFGVEIRFVVVFKHVAGQGVKCPRVGWREVQSRWKYFPMDLQAGPGAPSRWIFRRGLYRLYRAHFCFLDLGPWVDFHGGSSCKCLPQTHLGIS
jgi:hypothetical protein